MIPRSLAWVMVMAGLSLIEEARASVWFSSIPSSVQSGTGYYVEASASGGSFNLTIYKNGGYFSGTSGSGWGSVGSSTTDYGAQSVQYWAELYDWNTMEYDNAYASVTITVDTTPPSVPTGLGGSNVTMTAFTLSWSASSDNIGVTEYEVKRDSTSLGTTGSTSMGISGLTLNTSYGMAVRARDAAGNWSDWSLVCNIVTANDTTAPSVPAGLSGGTPGLTSFTLSWSASSDDVGVTEYEVKRDLISLGTTGATSLNVTGLTPSTGYAMTVRARDAVGNWSGWCSAYTVTTASDTTAPSVPAGLSSGTPGPTSFTLSWSASTDNVGVTEYEVMRDTTSLGATVTTSLNVTGLAPGTGYLIKVRARDAAANWSPWSLVSNVTTASDTTAPSVPAGLSGGTPGLTSFTLSWSASSDNVGVSGYEVMRGAVSLGTTSATSLGVTGLVPGIEYPMKVRALDASGNWSDWSSVSNVTTASDTTAPAKPSGLSGGVPGATSFRLSWSASADNVGVTAYEVMAAGISLGTTSATARNVTGLTPNTEFGMKVRARDAAGNWSDWSDVTTVTTAATAADSDGDGLSNDEEDALGTNKNGGSSNTNDNSNSLQLKIHQPN